ncbi:MAG: hypothetical protein IPP33_03875 [Flavobacteriales bacterium]|nr:hypothetical protein [Flavobacteriales bacterium]
MLFTVVFVIVKDARTTYSHALRPLVDACAALLGLWLLQWKVPVYVEIGYLLFASHGFYLLAGHAFGARDRTARWRWVLPAAGCLCPWPFTFTPWKGNDQHPSQAAKQVLA